MSEYYVIFAQKVTKMPAFYYICTNWWSWS